MTFAVKTRIFETSVTPGVGTLTLLGAQTGHQALSVVGANNYVTYRLEDGVNWEEGLGQYLAGPDRLTREKIFESSNAGAAVNWGGGTINIAVSVPAVGVMARRRLSLSVAGGAGTTVLTQDQQRRHHLEFTGALTGNRIIEVDATVWDWVSVYNNTSGAFTLTFRVTGQTGIAIEQGKRVPAHCDGTDVRRSDDEPASDALAGKIEIATQAEQETGSDVLRAVTPGRQQFHPSAAKGWVYSGVSGDIAVSYNVSSVTDIAVGRIDVNWATDFSSTQYAPFCTLEAATALSGVLAGTARAAGAVGFGALNTSNNLTDPTSWNAAAFGDQ